MISWIQITFQKHFRTVFAVLLAVTIISFIFTIGASPGIGRADHTAASRPFFDLNLAMAEDQQRLVGDASLSAMFQIGYLSQDNDQLQAFAQYRYASLYYANQLHIPAPTQAELSDYIKSLRIFAGQNGEFDPAAYNRFRDSLKGNARLSEAQVSRVLSDDYRVEQVNKIFAGPGYLMPEDVKQQLLRADTSWTLDVATVDYTSFKPALNPTDAELERYFTENAFRYEIPPRFSGYSVDFSAARFLPEVKLTDDEIRAFYEANPARFAPQAAPGQKTPAPAGFAAVKDQVASTLRLERARLLAQKAAADLTVFLFDNRASATEIPALLAKRGEKTRDLTPFARNEASPEYPGNVDVATEAFKLGADRLFSDALATADGAVVLFWKTTIPARQPAFSEVKAKVASDYLENERRKRFVDLGRSLKASIAARVKAGSTFDAAVQAAAAADSVKIESKAIPAFTLRQPPRDLDYGVYTLLERLAKGQLSDMTITGPKGVLVYVADKKEPAVTETNPMYGAIRTQLASLTARATGESLLQEVVERQLKTTPAP